MNTSNLFNRIAGAKEIAVDFDGFLSDSNREMLAVFGVLYSELSDQLHPYGEVAKQAFDNNVTPAEFVRTVGEENGFLPIGAPELRGGSAKSYNKAAALISEMVGTERAEGWQRRENGLVCFPLDDGFASLRPVKVKGSDNYGFGIEIRQGGQLAMDGVGIDDIGSVTAKFADLDLEKAVDAFSSSLSVTRGPKI